MSALRVSDLEVRYRSRGRTVQAVDGVTLEVGAGQIVGLVGESGCGKSSLARAAVGLEAPAAGTVELAGRPVRPLGWRRRSGSDTRLQMVFQNPYASLNPRRTVASQLADGFPADLGPARRRDEIARLLELVGLPQEFAGRFPHQFSGGQRQRIAIARALAPGPQVLVADEPVTALDASAQAQIVNLLVSLVRELDLGVLLISHDLALVREVADVTAVMYLGRVVETGPTEDLWSDPRHPYTRALIRALPRITDTPTLPVPLRGEVPDAAHIPTGCRFRARCPAAIEQCTDFPPTLQLGPRAVECWRAQDPDAATAQHTTQGAP